MSHKTQEQRLLTKLFHRSRSGITKAQTQLPIALARRESLDSVCVHSTYFDKNHEKHPCDSHGLPPLMTAKPSSAACIRNLAIIAHVDHGKTTLADALLHKAGLLHKDRVGDQDKGRSLDTLKDEKERGITIKSAAITLNLDVDEHILSRTGPNGDDPTDISTTDVYVGNLPVGMSKEDLHEWFSNRAIPLDPYRGIRFFSEHRSYAMVAVDSKLTYAVLALAGSAAPAGGSNELLIQPAGGAPMNRLREACKAYKIEMPSITLVEDINGQRDVSYAGRAMWPALGGVIVQAAGSFKSQKQARQATAAECLRFLRQQESGHFVSKEEDRSSTQIVSNDVASEPARGRVPLVLNLIDSPGHIEFNAEVTAALRVSDGALVVVDAIEGKAVQTDEVLRQALKEGVKPVLMLNKVDRLLIDKQYNAEEVYDSMQRVVDDINSFIEAHQLKALPDQRVSFLDGSVCFGSGYFGWTCSLDSFLKSDILDIEREKTRKALSNRDNFVKYIIRPILRMHRTCGVLPMKKPVSAMERITRINDLLSEKTPGRVNRRALGLGDDLSTLEPRKLLKKAMMAWLPAADALIDMIAVHVPSPIRAQRYKAPLLYSGDIRDDSGRGIYNCDANGPAIVYVSKMARSPERSKRLLAFGRVFSGTIRVGDSLRALRSDGHEGFAKIARIKLCGAGGRMHSIRSAEAGQLVALEGIEGSLSKTGTLTSAPDGQAIRHMNFSVAAVVEHSVRPKDMRNLSKMVAGFQHEVSTDSSAAFYKDGETQEYILAGSGELHVEVLVSSFLQNTGIEVELSDPIISFKETVQSTSSEVALAKSDNKHNRIWMKATPLAVELTDALAAGRLAGLDTREIKKALVKDYNWSSTEVGGILAFGPDPLHTGKEIDHPTCILVDSTFGLQIPDDFRSNVVSAFKQVVRQGILVNAPMRGVRFDLVDAKFHADAVHRRPNSVVPSASRAMRGAFLLAEPGLVEPLFKVDVTGGIGKLNNAYSILGQRGGIVLDASSTVTSDSIEAKVPVRLAFGLAGELRLGTHGHAHSALSFEGMRLVPEQEYANIVTEARTRRNLDAALPVAKDFVDKL